MRIIRSGAALRALNSGSVLDANALLKQFTEEGG